MKKLLAIMAVAGFVACNNSGEEKKSEGDTTTKTVVPADTTTAPADTTTTPADTTAAQ